MKFTPFVVPENTTKENIISMIGKAIFNSEDAAFKIELVTESSLQDIENRAKQGL